MPPHPLNACCCHLIEQGLRNIVRLAQEGDSSHILVEVQHIGPVATLLTEYELRKNVDQLVGDLHRYWTDIRPRYLSRADEQSIRDFDTAWYFLGFDRDVPHPDNKESG